MNRIFRIFSLVMMFALIASLAGMSATPVGAQSKSDALVQLSVVSGSFSASQNVMVHVIITNPNAEDLRVLSWHTPANGVQGTLFTVTLDGAPVNYLGALYKRAAPTDQDYITLAAGKSLEYDVNLSQYYSFAESGNYAIKYNTGSQNLYATSGPGKLVSNQLILNVDGRPDPLQKLIVPEVVTGSTTFYSCSGTQQTALLTARNNASTYANNGKTYFNNNRAGSLYQLWFGIYNASRWALPKNHYSLISNATDTATIDFDCTCTDSGVYAYVYPDSPYDVYLCGAFWNAPATGTDSKAGTLIHEMSHFTILGGTDDYVYGQTGAKALAINNPAQAVMNADNHEYFVENTPYTVDNAAAYTLGETSFNFGDQPVGSTSAVHIFTITSRGDINVSIGQVAVSGQFSLQNDTCSYNAFGAGNTCTFGISFAPASTGAKAGTVTIPSNAVIATNISLAGNGTVNVTPPTVVSITRVGATPTSAASVDFTVIFSESVTGVTAADFGLASTGSISEAAVMGISGSGTTYTVTVSTGTGSGTLRLDVVETSDIEDLAGNPLGGLPYTGGETYVIAKDPISSPWIGSVSIASDQNVVAVARPHLGSEVASYIGATGGSTTQYVPMLFKAAFGGTYNAALYIQNVSASAATLSLEFTNDSGTVVYTKADTLDPHASKGYWLPAETGLPAGFAGGVKVTSTQPILAVGRPHIGTQVMTYNGMSSGATSAWLPMFFKNGFSGSYNSALYIQNVTGSSADLTIEYINLDGTVACTDNDTLGANASKGYWSLAVACDTGSLPSGFVGGVKVTSTQNILAVGRAHLGAQITTYNGSAAGATSAYVPMLFKNAFSGGSYDAALYLQNVSGSSADVQIEYLNSAGTVAATQNVTLAANAISSIWLPTVVGLPDDFAGGARITSSQDVIAIGRPHLGSEITTYNGASAGGLTAYLPMLFKNAYGGGYDAAFYVQNTSGSAANVNISFYDSAGVLSCIKPIALAAGAIQGFWMPTVTCAP